MTTKEVSFEDNELTDDDLQQIAGGKNKKKRKKRNNNSRPPRPEGTTWVEETGSWESYTDASRIRRG